MAIIFPKINSGVLVSDLAFLQSGYEYGINDTGPFQRFRRRGRNADVQAWAAYLANAGWNVTVTRERVASGTGSGDTGYNSATADYGISTIEATAGWSFPQVYGTETPENIWELDPCDEQKELLSADWPNSDLGGVISRKTREQLPKMLDFASANNLATWHDGNAYGYQLNGWIFEDGHPASDDDASVIYLPAADFAPAQSLFLLARAGVTAFPIEASVIRHSQVTSNIYAVQASFNNVDRLISSASMYSIEGVPNTLLFAVPTQPSPNQFIETPESYPGAGDGDLQYGWRKVRPAVTRLNRMKWRIQQNYQFGLWAIKLYGSVL